MSVHPIEMFEDVLFPYRGDTKAKATEGVAGNLTIANRKDLEAENYKWGKTEGMNNFICKCFPS